MTVQKELTFKVNPKKHDSLLKIMEKYGDSDTRYFGHNQNGEDITVSVFRDHIFITTYQTNGWVRENTYWHDGTCEETFNGRWR